jgi:LacI family transcriptional regulator
MWSKSQLNRIRGIVLLTHLAVKAPARRNPRGENLLVGTQDMTEREIRVSRERKVTLRDVAERAGVSRTTASYILNGLSGRFGIAPDTEKRVLAVVDALGYRPNRMARSLRTARTTTIGVITDYVASGMFSSELLAGANMAARRADHLLVIGESEGDPDARDLLIDEMIDRQVDGIIYATRTALRTEFPARLAGTRAVMLNCYDPSRAVPSVLPDDRTGGRSAADILLAAGVSTDVFIVGETPDNDGVAGRQRLAGIQERFAEEGRAIAGTIECLWEPGPTYDAVLDWLRQGNVPRGLICMNDRAAVGAYQALRDHGLDIPGNVSVVSFDGSAIASWLRPRAVSIVLPLRQMGALAVELLLSGPDHKDPGLDGNPDHGGVHLVPMSVLAGDSVRTTKKGRDA